MAGPVAVGSRETRHEDMSKAVKDLITDEYKTRYAEVGSACLVSVIGLGAAETNQLRGELRERSIRLQVVKNSLARRALADRPLAALGSVLTGPCALVTGNEPVIEIAKLLVEVKKKYPQLELKVGIIEGEPDLIDVEQLAKRMGLAELRSELSMLIASPGRSLAGALNGAGGRLAGAIQAVADKQEGQEELTQEEPKQEDSSAANGPAS